MICFNSIKSLLIKAYKINYNLQANSFCKYQIMYIYKNAPFISKKSYLYSNIIL